MAPISFVKFLLFLLLCCFVLAENETSVESDVTGRKNHKLKHHFPYSSLFSEIGTELKSELIGRKNHKLKHHIPYKVLLFHYVHGAVIVLVIVKIVLAMTLVGMVSALIKMFAAIKFLFQDKEQKIAIPHHHHSHEVQYDIPGSTDFDGYHHRRKGLELLKSGLYQNLKQNPLIQRIRNGIKYYKRSDDFTKQDLSGGRNVGNEAAYVVQIKENKERRKRNLEEILNADDEIVHQRNIRSSETADENCMKKRVCLLHARAHLNPFYTFQLYFIKRDGLAQYWDHDSSKTVDDCMRAFPCHPGDNIEESSKTEKVAEPAKKGTGEHSELETIDVGEEDDAISFEDNNALDSITA